MVSNQNSGGSEGSNTDSELVLKVTNESFGLFECETWDLITELFDLFGDGGDTVEASYAVRESGGGDDLCSERELCVSGDEIWGEKL